MVRRRDLYRSKHAASRITTLDVMYFDAATVRLWN